MHIVFVTSRCVRETRKTGLNINDVMSGEVQGCEQSACDVNFKTCQILHCFYVTDQM